MSDLAEHTYEVENQRRMDGCGACQALRLEAGERNAVFYAHKLGQRGWAGTFTAVERAYLKAHPPFWYAELLTRPRRTVGFMAKVPRPDASAEEIDLEGIA